MLFRTLIVIFLASTISIVNAVKINGKESLRYYLEKPLSGPRISFTEPFISYKGKKAPGLTIIRRPATKKQKTIMNFFTVQSATVPAEVSSAFAELPVFLRAEQISDIDSDSSNAPQPENCPPIVRRLFQNTDNE